MLSLLSEGVRSATRMTPDTMHAPSIEALLRTSGSLLLTEDRGRLHAAWLQPHLVAPPCGKVPQPGLVGASSQVHQGRCRGPWQAQRLVVCSGWGHGMNPSARGMAPAGCLHLGTKSASGTVAPKHHGGQGQAAEELAAILLQVCCDAAHRCGQHFQHDT